MSVEQSGQPRVRGGNGERMKEGKSDVRRNPTMSEPSEKDREVAVNMKLRGTYKQLLAHLPSTNGPEKWATMCALDEAFSIGRREGFEVAREAAASECERAFSEAETLNLLHGAARIRSLSPDEVKP